MKWRFSGAVMAVGMVLLAGCASNPPLTVAPESKGPPPLTAVEIVQAVRLAGNDGVELVVTPLIDAHAQDLRERAEEAQADGHLARADRDLVKALELSPDDPDLIQWRAELAVLRNRRDEAEALAKQSIALGPKSGPLAHCRPAQPCRREIELSVSPALTR